MATDITTEILIAELNKLGVLDGASLHNIARRLDECGEVEAADNVRGVLLGNALDDPDARRAAIHVISDGGNSEK